jgi:hypothetical protein
MAQPAKDWLSPIAQFQVQIENASCERIHSLFVPPHFAPPGQGDIFEWGAPRT